MHTSFRRLALAIAATFTLALGALPAAHAQASDITITDPSDGATVAPGPLQVSGTVGDASGGGSAQVMYLVDVSGSTSSPTNMDCNGDGVADAGDNFNGDSRNGDVLDCEIAGTIALNESLAESPGVEAGTIAFGNRGVAATFPGPTNFVAPAAAEPGSDDSTPMIERALRSMQDSTLGLYNESGNQPGGGTNFGSPISVATEAFGAGAGEKWVFLISDGQASYPTTEVDAAVAAGVKIKTFYVGTSPASCQGTGVLARIAEATGQTCEHVEDPTDLEASLGGLPNNVRDVTVSVDGGAAIPATVNALGRWSANLAALEPGSYEITATVTFDDDSTATDTISITVDDGNGNGGGNGNGNGSGSGSLHPGSLGGGNGVSGSGSGSGS